MRQKVQSVKIKRPLNIGIVYWDEKVAQSKMFLNGVKVIIVTCQSQFVGNQTFIKTFCFLSFQYCKLFPFHGCFCRAIKNILVFITGWKCVDVDVVVVCHELSHLDDYA